MVRKKHYDAVVFQNYPTIESMQYTCLKSATPTIKLYNPAQSIVMEMSITEHITNKGIPVKDMLEQVDF